MPSNTRSLDILNEFRMGLFGYNIEPFLEECRTTEGCDFEFYYQYFNGWALGIFFYTDGAWDLADKTQGVCLQDGNCFGFTV